MKFLNLLPNFSRGFMPRAIELFLLEKKVLCAFIGLSILSALSEGATISMIIPILQSQAADSNYTSVPLIGSFLSPLNEMSKTDSLMLLSLIFASVIIVRGFLQFGAQSLGVILPLRLQCILSRRCYDALVKSQLQYIESKNFGETYTLIREHTQRVSAGLKAIINIFFSLALMSVYLVVMVALSPTMSIYSMIFIVFLGILMKYLLINPLRENGKSLSRAHASMHSQFLDTLHGMRLIHLRAAESMMIDKFKKVVGFYYNSELKRSLFLAGQSPFLMTASGLFICGLIFVGAMFAEEGDVSWLGTLLVFVISLYRMMAPALMITSSRAIVVGNAHSMEVIDDFLTSSFNARQPSGGIPFDNLGSGVHLKDVHFTYQGTDSAILKGINIDIPTGSMVALVGPSGAGKSSIVGLLTRFYDCQKGDILVGNVNLQDFNIQSLRRNISVVTQSTILFNDTIRNNLTFGLDDVSNEDIIKAVQNAAADEFIDALPDGYETMLGERGVRLSGGQQQRLALARAFLSKPDFLILDEATNQLDSLTEKAVEDAIEMFREQITVLVIAHRLATIQNADQIYVLNQGKIVESGNHEDLMRKNGTYHLMIEQQKFN